MIKFIALAKKTAQDKTFSEIPDGQAFSGRMSLEDDLGTYVKSQIGHKQTVLFRLDELDKPFANRWTDTLPNTVLDYEPIELEIREVLS